MSFVDPLDPDNPLAPPISTDPAEISDEMFEALRARLPGWRPIPTAPDTNILGAIAETSAAGRQAFLQRLVAALTELLGALHDIPRLEGSPATGTLTITALDALGHVEDSGITVYIGDVELVTTTALIMPVGEITATVAVSAVDHGAQANDVTGDVDITPLTWLASSDPVVLDAPLAGGSDTETDPEYQLRLIGELSVPRRAVRARDFVFYANRHPAVGLAWALPFYDANTDTDDLVLTISIVVADDDGQELSSSTLAEILADLQARTIENMDVIVVSPTYLPIDVSGAVVVRDGWDPDQVTAAVSARLQRALSPMPWASDYFGEQQPTPLRIVHVNDLIVEAGLVEGVAYVDELQIGDGSTPSITLTGPTTLPTPGTIDVTVAA